MDRWQEADEKTLFEVGVDWFAAHQHYIGALFAVFAATIVVAFKFSS